MKQAKIRLDVLVNISDEKSNPDGSFTMPIRVYSNFRHTLSDILWERGSKLKKSEFDEMLVEYSKLWLYEIADIPFAPLTTEAALQLKDCEIIEVEE